MKNNPIINMKLNLDDKINIPKNKVNKDSSLEDVAQNLSHCLFSKC